MASSWIAGPVVATVWAVLFVLVAIVHVAHLAVMSGRHCLWHAVHVLMAVGMVVMFWPGGVLLVPAAVVVTVYSLAAGTLAVGLVVARLRRARLGPLWLANVVDLTAMAYMFAMPTTRLAWLSVLGAVWFAVQMLGWASGRLGRVLERGGLGEAVPSTHALGDTSSARTARPTAGQDPANGCPADRPADHSVAAPRDPLPTEGWPVRSGRTTTSSAARYRVGAVRGHVARRVVDGGRHDWSVRIALAVMSAGMAFMLLVMEFAMPAMSGM